MTPSHTFSDHLHLPTLALACLQLFSSLEFTFTEQVLSAKHHVQDCLWVFSLNPQQPYQLDMIVMPIF